MIDPRSAEGITFLSWLDEKADQKRRSLEKPQHDDRQTQYLRGQIKALRMVADYIRGDKESDEPSG